MRRRSPLTMRKLNAMLGAVSAMCAGMENEGDWPEGVTMEDMEAAETWLYEQIAKRERPHQPGDQGEGVS